MYTSTIISTLLLAAAAVAAPAPSAPAPAATAKTTSAGPTPSFAGDKPRPPPPGPKDSIDIPLPPVVPVNTRSGNQQLITSLLNAPVQGDRARLLNQPGDWVFDFNPTGAPEGSESTGKAGFTVSATAKTFPALIGNGGAMTLGFLGPCGMNTAHVHNRATEINVVVQGRLVTNFIVENGVTPIANTLSRFQMTVFPQGAIHQEFNPDCEDTVFVAGFNNADPGVEQVAQAFFGLRPDVVSATLGGVTTINGADLESFRDMIPANVAQGVDACLKKCGIKRNPKRDINEILGSQKQ